MICRFFNLDSFHEFDVKLELPLSGVVELINGRTFVRDLSLENVYSEVSVFRQSQEGFKLITQKTGK